MPHSSRPSREYSSSKCYKPFHLHSNYLVCDPDMNPNGIWAYSWVVYVQTNKRTKLFEMKDLALKLLIHYIGRVLFESRIIYFDANGYSVLSIQLFKCEQGRTLYAINVHWNACNRIKWNKQMWTMFDFPRWIESQCSLSFGSLHNNNNL